MNVKTKRIRSAIPIYCAAAVWLLVGIAMPKWLLNMGTLALTIVLSIGAYLASGLVFKGKEVEVRAQADSGNAEIDRQIEEGRKRLDALKAINDRLPDPTLTANLKRITDSGEAIFTVLEKDTSKASEVSRFMNYYLPTTEKLMRGYAELYNAPSKGENITAAMKSVENSLSMIADAFEKQLDSLYQDRSFDMAADVQVLETILKSEGLLANGGTDLHFSQKKDEPKAQAGV